MLDAGKRNLLGVLIDAVDYEGAVARIIAAAEAEAAMSVSALAVHGVMTGVLDPVHRHRLNSLDLAVPDGQPVRWGVNLLHRAGLPDRVCGPELMLRTCAVAAERGLPIYLYGSRPEVLQLLSKNLRARFAGLRIVGAEPSRFRRLTTDEKTALIDRVKSSGARMLFVGLGCPRQEVWVFEYRDFLPMPILAVGAAFDFHAGLLNQAPGVLQRLGLEWAYRLVQEPRRLWRRYAYLNPAYLALLALQTLRLRTFDPRSATMPQVEESFG